MTSYDPFSYGSVPLETAPAGAAPDERVEPEAAHLAAEAEAPRPPAPRDAVSRPPTPRTPTPRTPGPRPPSLRDEADDDPGAPSRPRPAPRVRAVAPPRRAPTMLWIAAPVLVLVAGGAASCWLWLAAHNPVLGGIAAAASLVASLFAGLLLRR